ncbi:hypothetical protein D3C81_1594770 [compost metagenome]
MTCCCIMPDRSSSEGRMSSVSCTSKASKTFLSKFLRLSGNCCMNGSPDTTPYSSTMRCLWASLLAIGSTELPAGTRWNSP